ncbi:unnamed protein product [Merluccius merluccius]
MFPTESVVLTCRAEGSSEWRYMWYRDSKPVVDESVVLSPDGSTLSFRAAPSVHAGQYMCRGQHKERDVSTHNSTEHPLKVHDEIPIPELTQDFANEKVYAEEKLTFSCKVNSSGWTYLWFQDQAALTSQGKTYIVLSAASTNTGAHRCRATRGQNTPYLTSHSKELKIHVEARPWATVTLLTGWSEVFSTDRLDLKCEVQGSLGGPWNHTWMRGTDELQVLHHEKYTVTPSEDPDQSQYTCQGVRSTQPWFSKHSEPFKTKNLLKIEDKPEEANLFLTMAELKAYDAGTSESVDTADNGELMSFKY